MSKTILLYLRNGLILDGVVSLLTRKNSHIMIIEERNTDLFDCTVEIHKPQIIVVEVRNSSPYTLTEWLNRLEKAKKTLPNLKSAVIVDDETYPQTAEMVKNERAAGTIDAFFYSSSGLNYLVDSIEVL